MSWNQRRVEAALASEEFAFRMEQVLSILVDRLGPAQRPFASTLRPILHLIRFYLREPECYTRVLRSHHPAAFPGILTAYARLLDVAMTGLRSHIEARGSTGGTVAQAEGVAALDRLGSYCFTGIPRSLMGTVMTPLGTIASLQQGAWPTME